MNMCKVCGTAQATVYIVDLINGQPTEYFICNKCAASMNIIPQHFQIENIFKEILSPLLAQQQKPIEDIKCGECGMTYSNFKKFLRFGCAHDYDLFNAAVILRQIHGTDKHIGKVPKPEQPKPDFAKMRVELVAKLAAAVKLEDYESAAKLRDEINSLPKGD